MIYQFLPIRWLTPGHSGIDYRGLSYDAEILDGLRNVREGTFRAEDGKVPFTTTRVMSPGSGTEAATMDASTKYRGAVATLCTPR